MAGPFILFLLPFPTLTVDFIFSPEKKKKKKEAIIPHHPRSRALITLQIHNQRPRLSYTDKRIIKREEQKSSHVRP